MHLFEKVNKNESVRHEIDPRIVNGILLKNIYNIVLTYPKRRIGSGTEEIENFDFPENP